MRFYDMRNLLVTGITIIFHGFLIASASIAGTTTYTYDKKGQLIQADYGGGTAYTYTYDPAGNRIRTESCIGSPTNPSTPQNTVQAGYNAVSDNGILKVRALTFTENDLFDIVKTVTVKGGCDCSFAAALSYTTVQGLVTISRGTVVLENIIIK